MRGYDLYPFLWWPQAQAMLQVELWIVDEILKAFHILELKKPYKRRECFVFSVTCAQKIENAG